MERVRRGFRLAGTSWRVLRASPGLLVLVAAGLIGCVTVSLGLLVLLLGRLPNSSDMEWPRYLFVLPVCGVGSLVSTYCNAAVMAVAMGRLAGRDPTLGEGLRKASSKLPQLVGWTFVSIVVGTVLHVIAERLKLGGRIASRLLGLAWGLATAFVVPIVLFEEEVTVRQSIKRSAGLFKARWAETVVADGALTLALMLVAIPVAFVGAIGFVISTTLGIVLLVAIWTAFALVAGALDSVVKVAVYRYAVDQSVLGEFNSEDLADSFRAKRRFFS